MNPSLIITPNAVEEGKLFSIVPTDGSGDLSVVRATTKTRVNSLGVIESVPINVAALDYTDSTCPSILVEPQRTNLFLRSEEFNDAYWIKLNSTITENVITSPSGTTTADLLIANTSNSLHRINFSTFNVNVIGVRITVSIYVKKGGYNFFYFRENIDNGTVVETYFDLENGILGNIGANRIAQIINVGNDWYRCIISSTTTNTNINVGVGFGVANSNGVSSFTGNDVSGIYIWGAQLEAGANATSYIPTVASAVTRNADVISKTGISDLIGQSEGTIFVDLFSEFSLQSKDFSVSDGTLNNRITLGYANVSETRFSVQVVKNGTLQVNNSFITIDQNIRNKIAFSYKENDFKLFVNGILIFTDNLGETFNTDVLNTFLLNRANGQNPYTGEINLLALFKTALTDQECIAMTQL
jgi:hypothetical protein